MPIGTTFHHYSGSAIAPFICFKVALVVIFVSTTSINASNFACDRLLLVHLNYLCYKQFTTKVRVIILWKRFTPLITFCPVADAFDIFLSWHDNILYQCYVIMHAYVCVFAVFLHLHDFLDLLRGHAVAQIL